MIDVIEGRKFIQALFTCPKCKWTRSSGWDYGTVTDAPIALQVDDEARHVKRDYLARRCHCNKCQHMWDIVLVNEVKDKSQ